MLRLTDIVPVKKIHRDFDRSPYCAPSSAWNHCHWSILMFKCDIIWSTREDFESINIKRALVVRRERKKMRTVWNCEHFANNWRTLLTQRRQLFSFPMQNQMAVMAARALRTCRSWLFTISLPRQLYLGWMERQRGWDRKELTPRCLFKHNSVPENISRYFDPYFLDSTAAFCSVRLLNVLFIGFKPIIYKY